MKKIVFCLVALMACLFTGCDKDKIDPVDASKKIGYACGIAMDLSLDKETKVVVSEVIKKVKETSDLVKPDASAATIVSSIATEVIQKFINEGKITTGQGIIITRVADLLASGIDYMFTKYPKWRTDVDLAAKVVSSFCDGVSEVILVESTKSVEPDKEALEYFKSKNIKK